MRGFFAATALLLTVLFSQNVLAADSDTSLTLGWLNGCWVTADGATSERWTAISDGYLFGVNVTIKEGEVGFFEQLRIEPSDAGPTFQAYPMGVGPVGFVMQSAAPQAISFIRPEHDYPQKISYSRVGDMLTARVSLLDDSKPNTWRYGLCE